MLIQHSTYILLEYTKLGILIIFSLIISFVILYLSIILSRTNPDAQKVSTYECGFEPYEDAKDLFDIRFYLVAMLFLLFDLEAAFFFPWVVSFGALDSNGVWYMIDFIFELLIGYAYAWHIGALHWN
jgi:NADH-quinone oxidoreductase subunit A